MGLIDLIKKQILNTADSVRAGASKTLEGLISYIKSVQDRVLPPKPITDTSNLRELSDDDFDRIARERGYTKKDGNYRERTSPMATEGESQRVDGEDSVSDYEVEALTPEQKSKLDYLYYGTYEAYEQYNFAGKDGKTVTSTSPNFTRTTPTARNIETVKGIIKTEIQIGKTGSKDVFLVGYTIYRIEQKTGSEEIVEQGESNI